MATISPMLALGIFLAVFLVTCGLLKVNVGFGIGFGSIAIIILGQMPTTFFLQASYSALDSFPFLAVPTFIMAGALMEYSGIAGRLIAWCEALMGKVRGSIGAVTTIACMAFGLLTGSNLSTLSAIGKMMIGEMKKRGIRGSYAAALAASTCFLGILIPPSAPGIIYAMCAGISITDVWMSTVVPGVLIGVGTIVINWFMIGRTEPLGDKGEKVSLAGYFVNVGNQTFKSIPALVMPIIVFGGIYSGVFTPTEAGAVCVAYGLCFYLFKRFTTGEVTGSVKKIMVDSLIGTSSIGLLTAFSLAAGRAITMAGVSEALAQWVLAHCASRGLFLTLFVIILLFMGMFMNGNATVLILTPLLLPAAEAYGISALEFGAIMLVTNCYGGITPPFATNCFVASNMAEESFMSVCKDCMPFLILGIVVITIMCIAPGSYLWFVNLLAA